MRPITKEQRLERLVDTAKLLAINLRNATDYLSELKRDLEAVLDDHRDELLAEADTPARVLRELTQRFDDEEVTLDERVLRGVTP